MALWPRAEWITRPQDKSSRVEKLDTGRNVADPVLVAEYHKVVVQGRGKTATIVRFLFESGVGVLRLIG
jgi:beta-lactamase superfamily II metal-dependent hydrolase